MRNGEAEKGLGPSGQDKQVNEILLKEIVLAQKKPHDCELEDLQRNKKSVKICSNIPFRCQFYADILRWSVLFTPTTVTLFRQIMHCSRSG